MPIRQWRAAAPLALACALGCSAGASHGTAPGGVLTLGSVPVRKGCEAYARPSPLPSEAALFKPGELQRALQPYHGAGTLLLAARFDQEGQMARVAAIGGTVPDSLRAKIVHASGTAFMPDKRYAAGSLRVLLAVLDSVTATIGRSEYCPPVVVSGATGNGSVTVDAPVDQVPSIGTPHYSVLVSVDGRIVQSKLVRSSGNRTIDGDLARGFPSWRLRPALLDGAPIAAWIDIPAR